MHWGTMSTDCWRASSFALACVSNEALTLQIQGLDFRDRKARIRRTWADGGEGRMRLVTPKNGEARVIALPPSLIPQPEEQVAWQSKNEFLFRAKRGGMNT